MTKPQAAAMLQGLPANHITTRFYETRPGDIVLVHAAAGGVGSLLCGIVKMRGGTVIGRVSSAAKADAAREQKANELAFHDDARPGLARRSETDRCAGTNIAIRPSGSLDLCIAIAR